MASQGMNQLEKDIFSIQNESDFERVTLAVYDYQVEHCAIYREYIEQLGWNKPTSSKEIRFYQSLFLKVIEF